MNNRLGSHISRTNGGEAYQAFIPPKLPPTPPIALEDLSGLLEKASASLARLNNISYSIPNVELLLYMYVRKEALLSSQIEGTQSSLADLILFEYQHRLETESKDKNLASSPKVPKSDVEEVSNYVKALNHGLKRLSDGFPLSLRLLRDMHKVLLSGVRGSTKLPGEFRKSQNWIGGTRPGNALFVPPPADRLDDCLKDLELFLHDKKLPILIKAGIAHVQFETIHPFLDGNGRLGRLLIIILLIEGGLLHTPILYLSLYMKENRNTYFKLLQEVRNHGRWEVWLEFFLEGVIKSSEDAVKSAENITNLFADDIGKVQSLGRARFSCEKILQYLQTMPEVSVKLIADQLDISSPAARNALNQMTEMGILSEITGGGRDKIYLYKNYLAILEEGTDPL